MSPPGMKSITMYSFTIQSEFAFAMMYRSSQKKAVSERVSIWYLDSRFIAYTCLVAFWRTSSTSPNEPRPISLMKVKSSGFMRRLSATRAVSVSSRHSMLPMLTGSRIFCSRATSLCQPNEGKGK
uniref:Uncharacterized protein n=1 Tax=Anopheles merus TaxID=30066 RepID=A0A182URU5_ANOME